MLSKWSGRGLMASFLLASPDSLAAYSVAYVPSTRIRTPIKTRAFETKIMMHQGFEYLLINSLQIYHNAIHAFQKMENTNFY
jgi:hypothetical protein